MKTMIIGMNARFVHTNLAVRYLMTDLKNSGMHADYIEYTINQHPEDILQNLYLIRCDVMAFSCYIWNIELIKKLVLNLKKVRPELIIILGGPAVSYESTELMKNNDGFDLIVSGEGEAIFAELIRRLDENEDYSNLPGVAFRARGETYENPIDPSPVEMMDLPNPYFYEETMCAEKIYYYETSRGCPYCCSFCLSGSHASLRFLPMERVKNELLFFIRNRVKQVKFVDRTFNADQERACELFEFLIRHDNGHTNFHFEIGGELLDEKAMKILKEAPAGLFQFEIGIQSTNEETLQAIQRKADHDILFKNVRQLLKLKTIHIHVDLIAGLPYEDYFLFRNSFDDVFKLNADMIQLGFLKLIKGSKLKSQQQEFSYVCMSEAPYEVLSSQWIGYGELIQLKRIEKMLNTFWNSGKMKNTIHYILQNFEASAFKLFDDMAREWNQERDELISHKNQKMILFFQQFLCARVTGHKEIIYYLMHLDYYKESKQHKPWYDEQEAFDPVFLSKTETHNILQNRMFMKKCLPLYVDRPVKTILSSVHLLSVPVEIQSILTPYVSEVIYCFGDKDIPDELKRLFNDKGLLLFYYPQNSSKREQATIIKWIG